MIKDFLDEPAKQSNISIWPCVGRGHGHTTNRVGSYTCLVAVDRSSGSQSVQQPLRAQWTPAAGVHEMSITVSRGRVWVYRMMERLALSSGLPLKDVNPNPQDENKIMIAGSRSGRVKGNNESAAVSRI